MTKQTTQEMIARLVVSILCLLAFTNHLLAQTTVLYEDFEDQTLSNKPEWFGNTNDFSFYYDSLDQNTLLRLDAAPDPTRTQLITESTTTTGSWRFYIRQDFTPSNFNRAFIFLMADRPDLNYLDGSSVSGYALRTGDNESPRKFRLVRFDQGNQTVLIESDTVIEEGYGYTIRVARSGAGEWRLSIAPDRNTPSRIEGAVVTDTTYTQSSYFGLLMRYSSGNVNHFFFDDIRIDNTDPFRITDAAVVSASEIAITFNYPVSQQSLQNAPFTVSGLGSPSEISPGVTDNRVTLTYPEPIPDGNYHLRVGNLENVYGGMLDAGAGGEYNFSFQNPFTLLSANITSSRSVELIFSLPPDPNITPAGSFRINQNIFPDQVQLDTTRAILSFNRDLPAGEITITLGRIESIGGWRLQDGTKISTFLFDEATPRDIVINEILYRRASSDHPQFIELLNTTDGVYDLGGWVIETDRGNAEIPTGTVLQPGDYVLFYDQPGMVESDRRSVLLPGFVPLRTTGDAIILRNRELIAIDSLQYLPDWGGNDPGISLERKDPLAISTDPANWASSTHEEGSTPLTENSRYQQDQHPPRLLFAGYEPQMRVVRFRFDEFIDLSTSEGLTINGAPAGLIEPVSGSLPGNELLVDATTINPDKHTILLLRGISDFQGNDSGELRQPVAMPLREGDLVFNEIMFDPLDDDFDDLPNQSDYIELVNRRPYAISLEGVYLHDAPDENGAVRMMTPLKSQSKWIPARGYALFYPEPMPATPAESRLGQFFGIGDSMNPHSLQIERSTLSLPMGGREVALADSTGTIIDRVHYLPGWHNPNLIDTKGVSLERISPSGESTNAANWGSNALPVGGTPGYENSLFQTPQMSATSNTIVAEPNPFSPDGDGHQDNLMIRYTFDQPDFMLRVRIYDRHGRLVRNLADSHPAGFEGSLIWNGFTDGGVTGRIGIYIIHTEAFNAATGEKREFKTLAVLARQF